MANYAAWGGHKFKVTPKMIKSFRDMSIKGSCETEDKTAGSQKYVSRKNGKPTEITFVIDLNALTGAKNVYKEAMSYITEADDGKTDYLYLGSSKVLSTKMMLTQAEITEIATVPGKANKWISCSVKLTLKKGSSKDGTQDDPPGSGSKGYSAKVYYQLGSGAACYSVTANSSISYADALKKAKAKVPAGASWTGTSPKSASTPSQPTLSEAALEAARQRAKAGSQDKLLGTGLEGRQNQRD